MERAIFDTDDIGSFPYDWFYFNNIATINSIYVLALKLMPIIKHKDVAFVVDALQGSIKFKENIIFAATLISRVKICARIYFRDGRRGEEREVGCCKEKGTVPATDFTKIYIVTHVGIIYLSVISGMYVNDDCR